VPFYQDKYLVMDLYDDIRILAGKLIMRRNIRSGDGIQLATALDNEDVNLTFVSADQKLCDAATNEGLQVLNPEKQFASDILLITHDVLLYRSSHGSNRKING